MENTIYGNTVLVMRDRAGFDREITMALASKDTSATVRFLALALQPTSMLEKILQSHCVRTWRADNQLFALEIVTGPNGENCDRWHEVSTWSIRRLRDWLGY